ncbi:MAG: radical SAM protein [Planctomycetes bacterium]|nr:radical SAM protein [Planctomycetota bacterium]MBI3845824.1 radical SAM protein [Planctomycetota bacterium]
MKKTLQRAWTAFRHPVHPENRRSLAEKWAELPARFQRPEQMFGRHGEGCGATMGAMPRCDFACTGCYLGAEANQIPAEPVEAVKKQMRLLRERLGRWGNLQLTDGEITLRREDELIDLLRYARGVQLIPMLMTHGDTFRRRPGLLDRLVAQGGLEEVSIHVDTTQRGRKGAEWRRACDEADLNPLRDEFAQMIRDVRRKTGKRLRGATTVTVTRENLAGVPAIMQCAVRNADAFSLISFQPIAQVGRTIDGLGGGVDVDELWMRIAEGVYGSAARTTELLQGQMWFGHSACNRYVPGVVATPAQGDGEPRFHPVRLLDDPVSARITGEFFDRWGGLTFRPDGRAEAVARLLGVLSRTPGFFLRNLPPYLRHWLRRLDAQHPFRFAARVLAGRVKLGGLMIMSHHFMSREQAESPLGQERIRLCVFKVPYGNRLVSMCEANALGVREAHYQDLVRRQAPAPAAPDAVPATLG